MDYTNSPSPTSSDSTSSTLPTPHLINSSTRYPNVASPSDFAMSPTAPRSSELKQHERLQAPQTPSIPDDVFRTTAFTAGPSTPPPLVPSISVDSLDDSDIMHQTPTRGQQPGALPRNVTRDRDMMPPPSLPLHTPRKPVSPGGLNIHGLTLPSPFGVISDSTRSRESEEEDSLGDMVAPSPRRAAFKAALQSPIPGSGSGWIPSSPAWQSVDSYAPHSPYIPLGPTSSTSGLATGSPRLGRNSLSTNIPSSPLNPRSPSNANASNRQFDPTPTHGLHARNLSLYFPQPGQPQQQHQRGSVDDGSRGQGGDGREVAGEEGSTLIPPVAGDGKKVFGGQGGWSFGGPMPTGEEGAGLGLGSPDVKRGKRRGHHHKHSLSHNFFSFLDPTQTNPALATSPSLPASSTSPGLTSPSRSELDISRLATPQPVPLPALSANSLISPSTTKHKSTSTFSRGLGLGLDPHAQLYLSFGLMEFLVGAALWVEGQLSGWKCLAGVGYLVVFDALGVAVGMVAGREAEGQVSGVEGKGLRRPYGPARLVALLAFTQSLFLLFSAVYIAKESIEAVLLSQSAHDGADSGHGHGHSHGHAHGHGGGEGDRPFPHILLLLAAVGSAFASVVLSNHSRLVSAVGSLFLPTRYRRLRVVRHFELLLANPFSLTVAAGSLGVLLGSLIVPPSSLHTLDSSLSLLLTILAASLAYPTTKTFAGVLLQTAPTPTRPELLNLRRAIKDLKDDRRVLGIGLTRVWAVGACSASSTASRSRLLDDVVPGGNGHDRRDSTWSIMSSPPETPSGDTTPVNGTGFDAVNHTYPSLFSKRQSNGDAGRRDVTSTSTGASTEKQNGGNGMVNGRALGTKLVVTLNVHVDEGVSERDILDVTKEVWKRVSAASEGGEVCVGVKRGWEGLEI